MIRSRSLPLLALLLTLSGCAGGWRGGVAPAQWADGAGGGGAAVAASTAAPKAASPGVKRGVPSADGTTFLWKGEGGSVAVAGEFNAWSTSADPMSKQADGSWKLVKKLEPGRYAYKFVIDGTNWKPDPDATDKVDDGFGGSNSVVVVGGGGAAPAAPAAARATTPAAAAAGTTTSADGTTFLWKGEGGSVAVAGEFNAWSTSADPMSRQADGSWKLVKKLEPGRYAYKFVIDGTNWKPDPAATDKVDDGFGGSNSVVVVGGGGAAPASATAPAKAAVAVTGRGKAPEPTADGVRFTFATAARTVSLCGDFNGWAPLADPMTQQSDGTWTIVRKLAAGRHAYKYLVDGAKWATDPVNPDSEDDGFGGKNSILIVK